MNNKILSVVLVVGIASTGFAGLSSANSGSNIGNSNTNIEQGIEKKVMKGNYFGKRKGLKNLTDEEKTALEAMSDDEKKAFFSSKKEEMKAAKEAGKAVIDKLVAGETLTAAEEAIRLEMIAKFEEKANSGKTREGTHVIAKILAGDELTADDEAQLAEMQAKHAEREAHRAILEPIKAKLDAGEELTDAEQTLLDEHKSERKGKGKGRAHGKGAHDRD